MERKNNLLNYIKLIGALLIWAGLYHVAKPVTVAADPYLIAFLRYTIAAILLLIILKVKNGSINPKLNLQQWLLIFGVGAIGICSYNIFFLSAEALISGNIVAILYAFSPCLTTVASAYIFKTRLNLLCKFGIFLALVGSIGVVNYATPGCGKFMCSNIFENINRGEIYGILATVVFSCYSILSKCAAQQKIPGIVINTYGAIIGCVLLGIISAVHSDFSKIGHLNDGFWLGMLYMSVLATVVAYLWYIDALIHLGVFKTVVFQNTIPLQTVIIGYIFFNTTIGLGELVCGLIILAGVYLTNFGLTFNRS